MVEGFVSFFRLLVYRVRFKEVALAVLICLAASSCAEQAVRVVVVEAAEGGAGAVLFPVAIAMAILKSEYDRQDAERLETAERAQERIRLQEAASLPYTAEPAVPCPVVPAVH